MIRGKIATAALTALAVLACLGVRADAAQCGSTAAGFEAWKRQFAEEARGRRRRLECRSLDGHQLFDGDHRRRWGPSFGLSLDQFLAKRGASTIVARGRGVEAIPSGALGVHPATLRRRHASNSTTFSAG